MLKIRNRDIIVLFSLMIFLHHAACRAAPSPLPTPRPTNTLIASLLVTPSPFSTSRPPTRAPTRLRTPTRAPVRTAARTALPSPFPRLTNASVPTTVRCREAYGQIQHHQFQTPYIPKAWRVSVYVPPCYDPVSKPGYPVLVLLHGQNLTDEQWWRDLDVYNVANDLISSGEAPPFLIVMPYEEFSLIDPQKSQYDKAVGESLVEWIKKYFPTCPQNACWAIGGISRGASWALGVGSHYYKEFSMIGTHSLALFHVYAVPAVIWLRSIPVEERPLLYMDIGQHDRYFESTQEFAGQLVQIHYPHEWIINDGEHNLAYWQAHIEEYLRWYSEPWKVMANLR